MIEAYGSLRRFVKESMLRRLPILITAVFSAFAAASGSARAQAVPAPVPTLSPTPTNQTAKATPTSAPNAFTYSGTLRAYNFVRQNSPQNAANPNRSAFAPGGSIHTDYRFLSSPVRVGTTYFASDSFGLYGRRPQPQFNGKLDNTLPTSALATFDEAYLNYHSAGIDATVGDKIFNFLWAPSSDSRLKPAAYQGLDVNATLMKGVTVGVTRIVRFENRTSSAFTANTLLTSQPEGNSAGPIIKNTSGALRAYFAASVGPFAAHIENYSFYDLANLAYADAKYTVLPKSPYVPFVAAQYVSERNAGKSYLGQIRNNTIGFQIGANFTKEVSATFGFDSAPTQYADVFTTTASRATRGLFLPGGGTTSSALIAPGHYRVAYGGIASPYSDSYATDPLYTTSISQGMVDRRSAGTSYKLAAQYLSANKRLKAIASEAYYQYDNVLAENRTFEDDVDVQYFFNPVKAGTYKGFSVRQRFANRDQPTIPYDFKYIRTQVEYDF